MSFAYGSASLVSVAGGTITPGAPLSGSTSRPGGDHEPQETRAARPRDCRDGAPVARERHSKPLCRSQRPCKPGARPKCSRLALPKTKAADWQARTVLDPGPKRADHGGDRSNGRGKTDRNASLLSWRWVRDR